MREEHHRGSFIFGMLVGALAGALVVLFKTPKSGPALRADLAQRAGNVQAKAMESTEVVRGRSQELLTPVAEKVATATATTAELGRSAVHKVSERVESMRGNGTEPIAGVDADIAVAATDEYPNPASERPTPPLAP